MWPVTLPARPDDSWLRSFALAVGLLLGGCAAVFSLLGGFAAWILLGSGVAVGVTIAGAVWPGLTARAYAAWNRIARAYGRRAGRVLMRTCHRLVLRAAGRSGSKLSHGNAASRTSRWEPARTLPGGHFGSLDRSGDPASSRGSARNLFRASLRGGNGWMAGLIPYLILLRALEVDDQPDSPSGIYTLY